jgi:hypothetical protein
LMVYEKIRTPSILSIAGVHFTRPATKFSWIDNVVVLQGIRHYNMDRFNSHYSSN